MTVLVGVRCTDGIVIGADSIATSTMGMSPLVQLPSNEKIQLVGNKVIVAATGAVGFSQRLKGHADQMWSDRKFSGTGMACASELSNRFLRDLASTMVQKSPQNGIGFGALLAAVVEKEPYLIEFGTTDFQPEIKQGKLFYVTMGSGQLLADPFLAFVSRVLWRDTMPDVDTAKIGVFWTLTHTIKLAAGGVGGPIRLGVIRKVAGDWAASMDEDSQEQAQFIQELEAKICLNEPIKSADVSPVPTLK